MRLLSQWSRLVQTVLVDDTCPFLGAEMAYDDLNPQRQKFVDAYIETGCGSEAVRRAGYKTGTVQTASSSAGRILAINSIKEAVQERKSALAERRLLSLQEKQRMLGEIALANQTDNPMVAIRAIAELNRMEGHYAPTRTQTTTGSVTFIQKIAPFDDDGDDTFGH